MSDDLAADTEKKARRRRGDVALIPALAQGMTISEAAAAAGVSERTVNRRLHDFTFCAEVEAARQQMIGEALGILTAGYKRAAEVLVKLADTAEAEYVKRQACKDILLVGIDLRYEQKILDRLERIEAALFEEGGSG